MKKILIALLLVVCLLVVAACGRSVTENNGGTTPDVSVTDTSAIDASATDISASDVSVTDAPEVEVIPAPEGYVGCEIGELYFYYPEKYTVVDTSATDVVTVYADKATGANFSVTKTEAVDMIVSELSKTDLDAIGEKGAAQLEAILGEGVDAVYTYVSHSTMLEGKGVCFAFDIAVNYTELEISQTYSYYQMYVSKGNDVYMLTFATNAAFDDAAETYFAEVIESVELKIETAQ